MHQSITLAMPSAAASELKQDACVARQPLLLPQQGGGGQPGDDDNGGRFPWLAAAGFGYLTFSSGMAVYRSHGDPGAVAFVAFAYLDLVLLFCCLRRYERAEPGSTARDRLKLAVWLLTAALTLLFSYKVAAVMPAAAAALVWAMGLTTIAGGFAAFFCVGKKT
ncbi:hypothetical protein ACP70R_028688 [Stipagrostis hirtigluma subsp. patula]